MATQLLAGGRRSEAPTYTPRMALSTMASGQDLLMEEMLRALRGKSGQNTAPAAAVASTGAAAKSTPAEAMGRGSSTASFTQEGGLNFGSNTPPSIAAMQTGTTMYQAGKGLSALGVLAEDPSLAKLGTTIGTAGPVIYAGGRMAAGDVAGGVRTIAPMAAQVLGVPSPVTAFLPMSMDAAQGISPTSGDVAGTLAAVAVNTNPVTAAVNALSKLFTGKDISTFVKGAMTPVENANIQPVDPGEWQVAQTSQTTSQSTGQTVQPQQQTNPYQTATGENTGFVGGSEGE
jgi:hypothetical protein